MELHLKTYPGGYNVSCYGATDAEIDSMIIYSYEDLDGDLDVNWPGLPGVPCLNCADIDGDGYTNVNDKMPFDPRDHLDTDNDGIGDSLDDNRDGDNFLDFDVFHILKSDFYILKRDF